MSLTLLLRCNNIDETREFHSSVRGFIHATNRIPNRYSRSGCA